MTLPLSCYSSARLRLALSSFFVRPRLHSSAHLFPPTPALLLPSLPAHACRYSPPSLRHISAVAVRWRVVVRREPLPEWIFHHQNQLTMTIVLSYRLI